MALLKFGISFFFIWIFWLQLNIEKCESDVTVTPLTIDDNEGNNPTVTVAWSTETMFTIKIETTEVGESVRYTTTCNINAGTQDCDGCTKLRGSNIDSTCTARQIVFTFNTLEIKNHGTQLVRLSDTGGTETDKNVVVNTKAPSKDTSISCTSSNNCDNTVTCTCTAKSGNPKSTVFWHVERTGGSTVDLTSGVTTPNFDIFEDISSTLQYTQVAEDVGGKLACKVENSLGTIDARENVNYKDPATCTTVSTDAASVPNATDKPGVPLNIILPVTFAILIFNCDMTLEVLQH